MALFKCKMCGGGLEVTPGTTVAECEYCGTQQTLPRLDDDRKVNLYDRANHFRRNNEFDKAMGIYEQILNEDGTDAEAYWSLVLCSYGIEYVEDPSSRKRLPTVNRAQFTSVFDDDNYKSALQYADSYQKAIYETEAKAINEIQKGILSISQKEEPFDVFICYKETDNNGRRTADSVLAQELYYQLTQEGFKVFFSRITLEDKLGSAYEPYIFAALNSAKVMVTLGTKPEYFKAVWVRNEWSRFLALIKSGAKKMLIPAYKDMDPYDLPEEFSHLQAQDMSKLGFMQDLIRGIKKILNADVPKTTIIKETVVTGNPSTAPLLKRAFLFLEDSDWDSAEEYCEKVLDLDPECAQAYVGKLMVELEVEKQELLEDEDEPFDHSNNYQKALRFADSKLKRELESYIEHINTRNENARLESIYNRALGVMKSRCSEGSYKEAASIFSSIAGYKDAAALAEECRRKAEISRKNAILTEGKAKMAANSIKECELAIQLFLTIPGWEDADAQIIICKQKIEALKAKEEQERLDREHKAEIARKDSIYANGMAQLSNQFVRIENLHFAISEFRKIPGWRDADAQIIACQQKIEELKAKAETDRLERERQAELARIEAEKQAKRKKTIAIMAIIGVLVAIAFVVVLNNIIIPNNKYNDAIALMNAEKYQEAMSAFESLGGYKDSDIKAAECHTAILDSKYIQAIALMDDGKHKEAEEIFVAIGNYKDSKEKLNECIYQQAVSYLNEKNWDAANPLFEKIKGFKDSSELIHYHNYQVVDSVEVTCTSSGYKSYLCDCGEGYTDNLSALGHDFSAATCTLAKTCATCGITEGSPLGHTKGTNKCTRCNTITFTPLTWKSTGDGSADSFDIYLSNLPKGNYVLKATFSKVGHAYATQKLIITKYGGWSGEKTLFDGDTAEIRFSCPADQNKHFSIFIFGYNIEWEITIEAI